MQIGIFSIIFGSNFDKISISMHLIGFNFEFSRSHFLPFYQRPIQFPICGNFPTATMDLNFHQISPNLHFGCHSIHLPIVATIFT